MRHDISCRMKPHIGSRDSERNCLRTSTGQELAKYATVMLKMRLFRHEGIGLDCEHRLYPANLIPEEEHHARIIEDP